MRVFAGPNGSGKSTMINEISKKYDLGVYINPDEIEKELNSSGKIQLHSFKLKNSSEEEFANFITNHSLLQKAKEKGHSISLKLDSKENAIINLSELRPSYEAALVADFLRIKLIEQGEKLSFESVMSHESKLEIFELAKLNGYKVYLYFICTESPEINKARVKLRVQEGGHDVDEDLIESRYYNTLQLLKSAVKNTYRSFLWDNSGKASELILEVLDGSEITMISNSQTPNWCEKYLFQNIT
jgi:predicted ABC-type ATPase